MRIQIAIAATSAVLLGTASAKAADAIVVAEPEAAEYVRVCDTYGAGFFYIPGTQTCLKLGGYLRYDVQGGDDPYNGEDLDTWANHTRATIRFDARSETELGTLRTFSEMRFDYTDGEQDRTTLSNAYIKLGGFRVGLADSQFESWTNSAGDIINDDVVNYTGERTNQINYTFAAANGFSAMIGAEQGDNESGYDYVIDDYMPHVVAGVKYEQGWGSVAVVGGYDAVIEQFAGKVRADVNITDRLSAWVMGGYQSDFDETGVERNYFGAWNGDFAAWGGFAAKITEKAVMNGQLAYEDEGTLAAALNVAYELSPGFKITPELNYTSFDESRGTGDDAVGGIVRFQRNF